MSSLFSTVGGTIDRRQLLAVWMPLLAFVASIGAIVVVGLGVGRAEAWWSGLNAETRALTITLLVLFTILAGQLIMARRTSLLRLYEGYWPLVRWLNSRIDRPERPYPVPTRLGRMLRDAKEHPMRRYRIDAVTAWPRLYPVLPQRFAEAFDVATTNIEGAVVLSFLAAVSAVLGAVVGGLLLPWWGAIVCVGTALLVSSLAYRAAIRAAHPYGQLIRAAFDVYRFELLKAMGLTLPDSYARERAQWTQLHKLWDVGFPDSDHVQSLGYPGPATGRDWQLPGSKVTAPPDTTLTAVPVANGSALSRLLRRGIRVGLVVSPAVVDKDQTLIRFDDVLLVDAGPAGPCELVVALPAMDAQRLLGILNSATVYATLSETGRSEIAPNSTCYGQLSDQNWSNASGGSSQDV
jgi:hypothetical protein